MSLPPTVSCWVSLGIAIAAFGIALAAFSIAVLLLTGEVRPHGH